MATKMEIKEWSQRRKIHKNQIMQQKSSFFLLACEIKRI